MTLSNRSILSFSPARINCRVASAHNSIFFEIEDIIGIDASEAPLISAKVGLGIDDVLESVVTMMPPPKGEEEEPLQALIFDSFYDNYRGAICYVRIVSGKVRAGMRIRMMNTGASFDVVEVGTRSPGYAPCDELRAGDVGYIAASIKDIHDTRVGDTITDDANPAAEMLPGYRQVTPMVFCGTLAQKSNRVESATVLNHMEDLHR